MKLEKLLKTLPEIEEGKKVVSILSGGLDSTTLTHILAKKYGPENVIAVTYNYGQKLDYEIQCAQKTCSDLGIGHKIVDISFLGEVVAPVCALAKDGLDVPHIKDTLGDPQCPTYVPYRNLILLSMGFAVAESNEAEYIYYGAQGNDAYQYWDTVPEFLDRVNSVSDLNRKHKIQIVAPFMDWDKADEIKWGLELDVDYADSWTCYNGNDGDGKACGTCPGCSDRVQHFMKVGVPDPSEYKIEIDWEAGFKKFKED